MASKISEYYNIVELAFYLAMKTICLDKKVIPEDLLEQACERHCPEGLSFDIIEAFSESLIDMLDSDKYDAPISPKEMLGHILAPHNTNTETMQNFCELRNSLIEENANTITQIKDDTLNNIDEKTEDEISELEDEIVTLYNVFDGLQPTQNTDLFFELCDLSTQAHQKLHLASPELFPQ